MSSLSKREVKALKELGEKGTASFKPAVVTSLIQRQLATEVSKAKGRITCQITTHGRRALRDL